MREDKKEVQDFGAWVEAQMWLPTGNVRKPTICASEEKQLNHRIKSSLRILSCAALREAYQDFLAVLLGL